MQKAGWPLGMNGLDFRGSTSCGESKNVLDAGFWNTSNGSGGGKVVVGPAWEITNLFWVFMLCLSGMWGLVHGLAAKRQRERERRQALALVCLSEAGVGLVGEPTPGREGVRGSPLPPAHIDPTQAAGQGGDVGESPAGPSATRGMVAEVVSTTSPKSPPVCDMVTQSFFEKSPNGLSCPVSPAQVHNDVAPLQVGREVLGLDDEYEEPWEMPVAYGQGFSQSYGRGYGKGYGQGQSKGYNQGYGKAYGKGSGKGTCKGRRYNPEWEMEAEPEEEEVEYQPRNVRARTMEPEPRYVCPVISDQTNASPMQITAPTWDIVPMSSFSAISTNVSDEYLEPVVEEMGMEMARMGDRLSNLHLHARGLEECQRQTL